MSQSRRAMIECIFGWGKQHGAMRKTKRRGIARVAADFLLNLIAYNLIRIPKLIAAWSPSERPSARLAESPKATPQINRKRRNPQTSRFFSKLLAAA
jgi:hypothetical protein